MLAKHKQNNTYLFLLYYLDDISFPKNRFACIMRIINEIHLFFSLPVSICLYKDVHTCLYYI